MAIPFVFMTIYQLAFGGQNTIAKTGLAVVDHDSTFVSEFVARAFTQGELADFVEVKPVANLDDVEALFSAGTASAALVIPEGFGEKVFRREEVTLELYKNPRHFVGPQVAEGITGALLAMGNGLVNTFGAPLDTIQSYNNMGRDFTADDVATIARVVYDVVEGAPNIGAVAAIDVNIVEPAGENEDDVGDDFSMATLFFPGLLVFGLLSVSLGLETRFLLDRIHKVTHRMVTAPLRPWNLVFQQRLFAASFIFAVAVVSALVGGVTWSIAPTGLATVGLVTVALTLFIVGINGAIFSLSSSLKATSAISSIVMIALVSVGGGFFPAEFMAEGFQAISRMTPTGLANIAITQALTGRAVTVSIPLLFLYCAGFFVVSVFLARRRIA
jgi:ABC-type multidrug transport system permease subunit